MEKRKRLIAKTFIDKSFYYFLKSACSSLKFVAAFPSALVASSPFRIFIFTIFITRQFTRRTLLANAHTSDYFSSLLGFLKPNFHTAIKSNTK